MYKLFPALALAGLASVPALATAGDSPHTLSANVSIASNYIFRGISQTGGDPAVQGGFDYAHSSGVYIGTWASNVGWIEDYQGYDSGNLEIDLYGGYRGSLGDVSYDLGLITYYYPGKKAGAVTANTTELYASVGWKWFTLKYSYALSDEVFGFANADGSGYLDLSASVPLGDTGLTATAHWGSFKFKNNGNQDYEDWKIGMSYDLGKLGGLGSGMTLGVMYTDTNAKKAFWTDLNSQYLGKGTTTVWLSKSF